PLRRRVLPRGGGHREKEVAQRVVGQLVARGRVELADLGEHERMGRSEGEKVACLRLMAGLVGDRPRAAGAAGGALQLGGKRRVADLELRSATDRKSTRLNSSHGSISYAVFCLKKK